jgi:ATP-dependent DNA ligase
MSAIMLHAAQNAKACKTVEEAVASRYAVLEPKLDGWRIIASNDEGQVQTWTRTGTEVTGKMPAIEAALAQMPVGSALDGEVVAFERTGDGLVHSWGKVQSVLGAGQEKAVSRSHALSYVVFDVLSWNGEDWRGAPFRERRSLLSRITQELPEPVLLIPQVEATEEAYETLLARGYEGGIVKWWDAPYASGQRGKGWFKLKANATVDAVIIGYKEGEGSFSGLVGSIEFGQYDDQELVSRGHCSGMDMLTRRAISQDRWGHLGRVIEVAHMGVMPTHEGKPYGALRHPQFKRWRDDRLGESVEIHDA